MPGCTIVIPTHNREALLERAVRSALAACPADSEVLVVDDKSDVPAAQVLAHLDDARLRVTVNPGASGAASARNWGLSQARGEVVFFLDDDDEMLPDHCQRVLATDGPAARAGWGFASTIERREGAGAGDLPRPRGRLRQGLVPQTARPRDQVAAMSDGFWIRKTLFLQIGGLDPLQTIDEDTDLCVRLLAAGHRPWFEPSAGTVVYRGYVPARAGAAQLTVATPSQRGLACYRRTHDKSAAAFRPYSAVRWFLATRFLRRAVKAGRGAEAMAFAQAQSPRLLALSLMAFVQLKRLAHRT